MLIFALHSTSDDQLSNLRDKSHPKWKKNGHWIVTKVKCSFLDYIQLLMSNLSDKSCTKCKIMANIFMAKLIWPKIDALPLEKKKLEIWQKKFMVDLAWPKSMYLSPRNEKLKIWQKCFMGDLAWPKFNIPPPWSQKDVDGTRMEHECEQARGGTCMHDRMI